MTRRSCNAKAPIFQVEAWGGPLRNAAGANGQVKAVSLLYAKIFELFDIDFNPLRSAKWLSRGRGTRSHRLVQARKSVPITAGRCIILNELTSGRRTSVMTAKSLSRMVVPSVAVVAAVVWCSSPPSPSGTTHPSILKSQPHRVVTGRSGWPRGGRSRSRCPRSRTGRIAPTTRRGRARARTSA